MKIGYPYRINRSENNHTEGEKSENNHTEGEKSENEKLPNPEASRVIITRNAQKDDHILDYFRDDSRLAQEIISGCPHKSIG